MSLHEGAGGVRTRVALTAPGYGAEGDEDDQQQKLGARKGIVMDGRDIGTVVFPKAELKIFMTADNAVRVERRFRELYEKNPNITIEEVKNNLEMRDYIDSHREVSPLRQAEDAIVLDNTNLTPEEQLNKALGWAKERKAV